MRAMARLVGWVLGLFKAKRTWSVVIVRRYADANGAYVGELYLLGSFMGVLGYQMIGVSLDTLPLEPKDPKDIAGFSLDTEHDFLAPMPAGCVRVGAQYPEDNDAVRANIARLAREGAIQLQVQNRFIEHVMRSGKGDS
jgi:hypothetical protein